MSYKHPITCSLLQLKKITTLMEDSGYSCFYSKLDEIVAIFFNTDIKKNGRFGVFLRENKSSEFLLIEWLAGARWISYFPKVKTAKGKRMRALFESNFVVDPPILEFEGQFYCSPTKYVSINEFEKIKAHITGRKSSKPFRLIPKDAADRHLERANSRLEILNALPTTPAK